ncbi:MAG TPA: aldehyde dehydrogenase family protein, partial [Phycisphaerae bacterium]
MTVTETIQQMATRARTASRQLATVSGAQKNLALNKIADAILANQKLIMDENAKDLAQAKQDGLTGPLVARLTLAEKKIASMAQGLREIALQTDPVGQTIEAYDRPNGLRIEKRRVPIGVVAIIFESRPNVTADAAGICLKSGNACILRGGKEAIHSNTVIARLIREGLAAAGISQDAVQLVETTDRAAVVALATAEGLIDLIIPRGGEGLIRAVVEAATIPVIKHYKGV